MISVFQPSFKDRIAGLLRKPCECASGDCYKPLHKPDVISFLSSFEKLSKREQDSVLFLACGSSEMCLGQPKQREYFLMGHPMKRGCMEQILGISSHRTDRIGSLDQRFGKHPTKPSELTASIDAFCCILYNSIAEPLPDRFSGRLRILFSNFNFF